MSRFATLLIILLATPALAFASSITRTGDNVTVSSGQVVEGDFYSGAGTVVISGEVTEDLLVGAGNLNLNGQVGKDVSAIAGQVDVNGTVGDDVRIVAGQVTVAGEVMGDLVVVADFLNVLSTAKINGDILFFGTRAEISGEVGKSILGTSEQIRIDGLVGGDVDIKTSALTLGEMADVTGVLKYTSANELTRAQNARVAGKISKIDPITKDVNNFKNLLIPLLVFLFAALVWYLLFSRLLTKVTVQAVSYPLRSMLIGFGLFFLTPIAVGILIMSTLGGLVGAAVLFMYLGLLVMSVTITGVISGAFLLKLAQKSNVVNLQVVLIGTTLTFLIAFIPVVGSLVLFSLVFITLGALVTHLYRLIRSS